MLRQLLIALVFTLPLSAFAEEETGSSDEGLYYAAKENLKSESNWELRAAAGHDFSNSFLAIYGFQAGVLYLADPSFSFGLEGTGFLHSKKGTGTSLADEMEKLGYNMYAVAPLAKANAVFRVTPLSGMVNFFSSRIVKVDLSLLARAGAVQYQVVGWGPSFGLAVETLIGISKDVGVNIAFHYEYEKPGSVDWIWRGGFLVGPSVRF